MLPQRRRVNRSQTGPVPLECERSYGRSASASGGTRTGRHSSSGCSTPVTFVKSKNTSSSPRPQSQSMDSGLVSLPSSSVQVLITAFFDSETKINAISGLFMLTCPWENTGVIGVNGRRLFSEQLYSQATVIFGYRGNVLFTDDRNFTHVLFAVGDGHVSEVLFGSPPTSSQPVTEAGGGSIWWKTTDAVYGAVLPLPEVAKTVNFVKSSCSMNPMPCSSGMLQVHEFLFIGNADAASKIQQNCQQNIRYFVNVSEKPSSSTMRSSQSCNCLDQATHKTESSVVVPFRSNVPIKELFEMFTTVNDVIRQARNKAQRVLIFSEDAQATCQAFALAYSIQYYNLDFHRALCNFEKLEVKIEINNSLRDVLIKWAAFCEENRVREMAISRRAEWKETRPATVDCAVKRMAWQ